MSTNFQLKTIAQISGKFGDKFKTTFLPAFKYHNPKLIWSDDGELDRLGLKFTDGTAENISSSLSCHDLAERIIKIDEEKHILKEKYKSKNP